MNDRNENRLGYKETKVGWIPEDWEAVKLGTIGAGIRYAIVDGPFGSNLKSIHYRDEGVPVIQSGFVTSGLFKAKKYFYVEEDLFEKQKRSAVRGGDIIMAKIGAQAGRCAIMPKTHPTSILAGNCLKISPHQKRFNTHYTTMLLHRAYAHSGLIEIKTETAQPAISLRNLKTFSLAYPPLPEQEAIAEVLGCWDEGLESLDKLIDAKKLRKKGLMQKLLTGTRRLPGFTKDWKEVRLGDVFDRVTKKNKTGCNNNLTISGPLGLINQEEYFKKRIASTDNSGYYLIKNGEFAYNKSYCNGYPLGAIKRLDRYDEGVVSTLYICFALKDGEADSNFMAQYFENGELDHEIYRVAQEGARNHGLLNITATDYFNTKITIPPTLDEQKAIAAVLETADEEIRLLEAERDALTEQKKGLMQKLLTGEVRMPEFATAV